eukprot:TRINITY_DN3643_c0_g1_i1.p1 TRINITY_DN3643_c0_g1~~TRINITY_DN3643_c0_g1_i1.p1  ORF type:complete len:814 (-),score=257.97 TRINITY_DN3643_c0_g1_i1:194-2635(-)
MTSKMEKGREEGVPSAAARRREKKGKHQELLANYLRKHGIEKEAEEVVKDTTIDGADFDATGHFHSLLKEKSLVELLHTDRQLSDEVKNLDSDMKNLVYENYNKFISATDTIRKMKSNVENMEEEMRRLSETMDKISTHSDHINSTLSTRREKIMNLGGVHRLLKNLHFLVDLPSRLSKCIELEAYSQAVKNYNQSTIVLQKYDSLPSFKSIHQECEAIVKELRIILHNKLKDPLISASVLFEILQLLLELKEDPEVIRNEMISIRKTYLERNLDSFPSVVDGETSILQHLKQLHNVFLYPYSDHAKVYKSIFIDGFPEKKKEYAKLLEDFTRGLFGKYFEIVQSVVLSGKTDQVYDALEMLYHELVAVHSQLPALGLADRVSEHLNKLTQGHIEKLFSALQTNCKERIANIMDNEEKNLGFLAKQITNQILTEAQDILEQMKPFFHITNADIKTARGGGSSLFLSRFTPNFVARIDIKVQQLFLFLNIILQDYYEDESRFSRGENLEAKEIASLLVLAKMCIHFETSAAQQLATSLIQLRDQAVKASALTTPMEITINVQDLRLRFKQSAENLLSNYVRLQSLKISQMIYKSIDTPSWRNFKEPKGPRGAVEMVIDEFLAREQEIEQVFESEPERQPHSSDSSPSGTRPGHNRVPSVSSVSSVKYDPKTSSTKTRSLFDKKIKFLQTLEFNKNCILTEIIKISLKALGEYVRVKTFNKFGLNQVQLDTSFMKSILSESMPACSHVVKILLDEVVNSATDRCLEPVLLEQDAVNRVCLDKKEKWSKSKMSIPAATETKPVESSPETPSSPKNE